VFLEPHQHGKRSGWIEVICGSMFSGKTEELIRRLKRAQIANMRVEIFKPETDTRYHEQKIVSHDANTISSTPVSNSRSILLMADNVEVIGIDEAQFFDEQLPEVCDELANRGARVILAGLDMDFKGNSFGPMPILLARAEYITKVHAICMQCGNLASYSYRLADNSNIVLLGEKEHYEPRCRECYYNG
jgi:thymidine kinase